MKDNDTGLLAPRLACARPANNAGRRASPSAQTADGSRTVALTCADMLWRLADS